MKPRQHLQPLIEAIESQDATVIERVKQALGVNSLDGVADRLGVLRGTVGSWSARRSVPLDALVKTAQVSNCSLDWLILGMDQPAPTKIGKPTQASHVLPGHNLDVVATVVADNEAPWRLTPEENAALGTQLRGPSGKPPNAGKSGAALLPGRDARAVRPLVLSLPQGERGGPGEDYEVIPKHRRPALAGTEGAADEPNDVTVIGELAFSFDWMRRNLGHTSGRLSSIQVRGNSMATTLLDGETIIVDESITSVEVDDIYVLDVYGRRLVKRVQHLVDGTLVLISDNPSYQRETIPRDRARDVKVIGRMVWPRVR